VGIQRAATAIFEVFQHPSKRKLVTPSEGEARPTFIDVCIFEDHQRTLPAKLQRNRLQMAIPSSERDDTIAVSISICRVPAQSRSSTIGVLTHKWRRLKGSRCASSSIKEMGYGRRTAHLDRLCCRHHNRLSGCCAAGESHLSRRGATILGEQLCLMRAVSLAIYGLVVGMATRTLRIPGAKWLSSLPSNVALRAPLRKTRLHHDTRTETSNLHG
jgi:hypothetical protein